MSIRFRQCRSGEYLYDAGVGSVVRDNGQVLNLLNGKAIRGVGGAEQGATSFSLVLSDNSQLYFYTGPGGLNVVYVAPPAQR